MRHMAVARRSKDEGAGMADACFAFDLGLDKGGVAPAPQDFCAHFDFARQWPDKGDLCGGKWRQIVRQQVGRAIGHHRAETAIAGPALMPVRRYADCVAGRSGRELGEV